ncbi:hypothetical protein VKT23_011624 [Stygiomarasmius scandens]|uniref:Transport protein particle component n=1 Tax=Marasmiellus scandens TaxID=2682957 RepID=A0ABR1JD54_9AGAR
MPPLAALADPPTRYVDGALMDYFLIETVNTLRESSAHAVARSKKIEKEMLDAGLVPQPQETDIYNEEDALRSRLEAIGMHVGANFAERLCRDRSLFTETLDVVKFICKDLWAACWDKQVDNLRTNHRGVYVLQDNAFKTISRLSSWQGRPEAIKRAKMYVAMPAGLIKGALQRLGYNAVVTPEITSLPQCTFQVKLPKGS